MTNTVWMHECAWGGFRVGKYALPFNGLSNSALFRLAFEHKSHKLNEKENLKCKRESFQLTL
jgi:hypothetical protein